jgi:hypothetical protein
VHGAHGSGDGFYGGFERFPEAGVLVLVFTNFGGSGPAFGSADLAASIALGEYPSGRAICPRFRFDFVQDPEGGALRWSYAM